MLADFENCSLRLVKDDKVIFSSGKSGLRPLVECVKRFKGKVNGCVLCDKVVGLAAARLIVYSSMVDSVVTKVCSRLAKELLDENSVRLEIGSVVENILNNDRTDVCPMEKKAVEMDEGGFFWEIEKRFKNSNL